MRIDKADITESATLNTNSGSDEVASPALETRWTGHSVLSSGASAEALALSPQGSTLSASQIEGLQRRASSRVLAPGPVDVESKEGRRAYRQVLKALVPLTAARQAPNAQFLIRAAEVDDLGMTHFRLQQTFIGPTAFEKEVVAHVRKDGSVFVTHGVERLESAASVEGWQVPSSLPHRQAGSDKSELMALPSIYRGQVAVAVERLEDGTTLLRDTTRGAGIAIRDSSRHSVRQIIEKLSLGAASRVSRTLHRNDDVALNSDGRPKFGEAIDAHYAAGATYDFLRDVLGRNSIDGRGERLIVTVGAKGADTSAWNGRNVLVGIDRGRPLADLDVVAHELAHGLVSRTAALGSSGEPGALNEGYGDIIGTGVEWYVSTKEGDGSFNYHIGEASQADLGYAVRNLAVPGEAFVAEHLSLYHSTTESHSGSGIVSHAFYLAAEGGENRTAAWMKDADARVPKGVGIEKALKIFGRALMFYMTPTTTFAEARVATLHAAHDLFGVDSVEARVMRQAWAAVGVKSASESGP